MLHTEHDNTQNEDLQGNGKDEDKKFIKMKVVTQDNSEVQFKVHKQQTKSQKHEYYLLHKLCQE